MAAGRWRVAWVTGASTGIGREIALQLAAQGVKVAASARNAERLAGLGAGIRAYPVDVTDVRNVAAVAEAIETDLGPIDLAIFAAGVYRPAAMQPFDPQNFHATMATNYFGVINGLAALLPKMLARKHGHIAWIASVAGYRGLPKAAAYGPTKAALINLAESLKPELSALGLDVSVINPGFVRTPLTEQNDFEMPFLMEADEAARLTLRGLAKKKFEIAYPLAFVTILKITRLLPYAVFFRLIRRFVLKA